MKVFTESLLHQPHEQAFIKRKILFMCITLTLSKRQRRFDDSQELFEYKGGSNSKSIQDRKINEIFFCAKNPPFPRYFTGSTVSVFYNRSVTKYKYSEWEI